MQKQRVFKRNVIREAPYIGADIGICRYQHISISPTSKNWSHIKQILFWKTKKLVTFHIQSFNRNFFFFTSINIDKYRLLAVLISEHEAFQLQPLCTLWSRLTHSNHQTSSFFSQLLFTRCLLSHLLMSRLIEWKCRSHRGCYTERRQRGSQALSRCLQLMASTASVCALSPLY